MPKRYIEVMAETDSRARLAGRHAKIRYGSVGAPHKSLDMDGRVAWLDLVVAAPIGKLERHHRSFLELTARLLCSVRRGEADKGKVELLGKCLRDIGLTPGTEPTVAATLDALEQWGL